MNSSNQSSFLNSSRRSNLFSNRSINESMASRQNKEDSLISTNRFKSSCYEGKINILLHFELILLFKLLKFNLFYR